MVDILRSADLSVIGANGGGWVAPAGTAAPEDLGTPPSPWQGFGAISDDGLTYGFDEDNEEFTPWGLTSPFRTIVTKSVRTFGLTLWETANPVAKSLMYRIPVEDFTPDEDGITKFAESGAPTPDRRAFYFMVVDGSSVEGFYVPAGEVSDRSDVSFKSDEMAGYEITISAYPDEANNTVYHQFKAPQGAGSTAGGGALS